MPDRPPPPSRRDSTSPAASHHGPPLTPEQKSLRDAYLAELWPTCPEYSREEREVDRALAAERARRVPGQAA